MIIKIKTGNYLMIDNKRFRVTEIKMDNDSLNQASGKTIIRLRADSKDDFKTETEIELGTWNPAINEESLIGLHQLLFRG